MSVRVVDGTGTRYAAGVDSEARLRVASVNKAYAENVNQQYQKAYTVMYSQTPGAGEYFVRTKKVRKCACFITGLLYNIGKHKEV